MDTKLSVNILVKIFRYLPLKERVRIGRVNKKFHLSSDTVVSETKSLTLSELFTFDGTVTCDLLERKSLSHLINLCSSNLERIHLTHNFYVKVFSKIYCPNLLELCIDNFNCDEFENAKVVFDDLFRNVYRNLKKFTMKSYNEIFDYRNVLVMEKLETLKLTNVSVSIAGRCPNLKNFNVFDSPIEDYSRVVQVDEFFVDSPNIETIDFYRNSSANKLDLGNFAHFWQLKSLRQLRLTLIHFITDDNLVKMAQSFPQLENLDLSEFNGGNRGIAALSALKNLTDLSLGTNSVVDNVDEGMRRMANCKRLQYVLFPSAAVQSTTLIALVRFCGELKFLGLGVITDVDDEEKASEVVSEFGGFGKRNLTIALHEHCSDSRIWRNGDGGPVDSALQKLKRTDGSIIEIIYRHLLVYKFTDSD